MYRLVDMNEIFILFPHYALFNLLKISLAHITLCVVLAAKPLNRNFHKLAKKANIFYHNKVYK